MPLTNLSPCGKGTKVAFAVLNVFYIVLSGVVFSVGVYLLWSSEEFKAVSTTILLVAGVTLVVGGVAGWILATYGMIAAVRQMRVFLILYAVLCTVLALYEIAIGTYGILYPSYLNVDLHLRSAIHSYHLSADSQRVVDYLQSNLKCCGVNSSADWLTTAFGVGRDLPQSCCVQTTTNMSACTQQPNVNTHTQGCLSPTVTFLASRLFVAAGAGVSGGLLLVPGVVLALILAAVIHNVIKQNLEFIKAEAIRLTLM